MGEKTIPIFPCRSIDETWAFYQALGFERTFYQTSPNPYLTVRRGDIDLQFFGWKRHDPAGSMNMCYITTTGVDPLYEAFRGGLKAALGRVPTRGLPRIGALKDMTYGVRQFLITDPDGNQLRVGQPISDDFEHSPVPKEKVARALHMAVLMGDSKEEPLAAARILDHLLGADVSRTAPQQFKALVLRADMAVRLDDPSRARELAAEARRIDLPESDRAAVQDELLRLEDLEGALG